MNRNLFRVVTTVSFVAWVLASESAHAAEPPCPSANDTAYSTQVGETWSSLGGRAYCLDGPNARSRSALALYEYNRGRVGPDINKLPDGTTVCLPEFLHGPSFDAERCRSAPTSTIPPISTPTSPVSTPAPPVCGNGQRDSGEICDGNDLGGMTCTAMNLPAGKLHCRVDCQAFDATECLQTATPTLVVADKTSKIPSDSKDTSSKSTKSWARGDVALGAMLPLSSAQRIYFYGAMGLLRAGGRFGMGPVELALHGVVGGSQGTTNFNQVESELGVFCAGGSMQIGVPLSLGLLRVVPGAEALRLFLRRKIDPPNGYRPEHIVETGGVSFLGAFLRTEYQFRRFPKLVASIDVAVDFIPHAVEGISFDESFQLKTLGGVSYAAF